MFSQCTVIHQQEVGMVTIEAGLLAQRVPQLLVGPKYLNVPWYQPQHNSMNIAIDFTTCLTDAKITTRTLDSLKINIIP